jgi:hypothetical protein
MNYETSAIVIAVVSALAALGFWIWLVAVPVARSFSGGRDRSVAVIASFYTLVSALMVGGGLAVFVVYNWDRIGG